MGTERNDSARPEVDTREQRELLAALHDAVDALTDCLERLHHLIDRVESRSVESRREPASPRTQVSFGGGPSVLGGPDAEHRHAETRPGIRGPEPAPERAFEREFGERALERDRRPERSDRFEGGGYVARGRAGESHEPFERSSHFTHSAHFEPSSRSESGDHTFHDDLHGGDERHSGGARRARRDRLPGREGRPVGTPELMAVSEMVHLGYTRSEIAERLRARWGDEAAAILREALD